MSGTLLSSCDDDGLMDTTTLTISVLPETAETRGTAPLEGKCITATQSLAVVLSETSSTVPRVTRVRVAHTLPRAHLDFGPVRARSNGGAVWVLRPLLFREIPQMISESGQAHGSPGLCTIRPDPGRLPQSACAGWRAKRLLLLRVLLACSLLESLCQSVLFHVESMCKNMPGCAARNENGDGFRDGCDLISPCPVQARSLWGPGV